MTPSFAVVVLRSAPKNLNIQGQNLRTDRGGGKSIVPHVQATMGGYSGYGSTSAGVGGDRETGEV